MLSTCTVSSANAPEGMDSRNSEIITGIIDRRPPQRFSEVPEPADGFFSPGDEISVEFDEELNCRPPLPIVLTMVIGENKFVFHETDVLIVCSGRKVSISLAQKVSLAAVKGLLATVTLSNVADLASNVLTEPVKWSFVFAAVVSQADASARVSGLILEVPCKKIYNDPTNAVTVAFVAAVVKDIAAALDTNPKRITIENLHCNAQNKTELDVVIAALAPSASDTITTTGGSRRRSNSDASASALASALTQLVNSDEGFENAEVVVLAANSSVTYVVVVPTESTNACSGASTGNSGSSASTTDSSSHHDTIIGMLAAVIAILVIRTLVDCIIYRSARNRRQTANRESSTAAEASEKVTTGRSSMKYQARAMWGDDRDSADYISTIETLRRAAAPGEGNSPSKTADGETAEVIYDLGRDVGIANNGSRRPSVIREQTL